jgi:hypothetical protein
MPYPDVTATDPNKALLEQQFKINDSFNITHPTATALSGEINDIDDRLTIAEGVVATAKEDLIALTPIVDGFTSGFSE